MNDIGLINGGDEINRRTRVSESYFEKSKNDRANNKTQLHTKSGVAMFILDDY